MVPPRDGRYEPAGHWQVPASRGPRFGLEVDFWLATLDPLGGRRLNPRYLGIGLMGAVLADFVGHRYVTLEHGYIVPRQFDAAPDPSSAAVLAAMAEERTPRTAQDWLRGLGHAADERVTERMLRENLAHQDRKRWYERVTRYVPAYGVQPELIVARLAVGLLSGQVLTPDTVMLGGLLEATGLGELIFGDLDPAAARTALTAHIAELPDGLRALLRETVHAIGSTTLHGA